MWPGSGKPVPCQNQGTPLSSCMTAILWLRLSWMLLWDILAAETRHNRIQKDIWMCQWGNLDSAQVTSTYRCAAGKKLFTISPFFTLSLPPTTCSSCGIWDNFCINNFSRACAMRTMSSPGCKIQDIHCEEQHLLVTASNGLNLGIRRGGHDTGPLDTMNELEKQWDSLHFKFYQASLHLPESTTKLQPSQSWHRKGAETWHLAPHAG